MGFIEIKNKVLFAISNWMASSYEKHEKNNATREAIKLASEENISYTSIEGCTCSYLDCTEQASLEIEEKPFCGHHALQMLLWLIDKRLNTPLTKEIDKEGQPDKVGLEK